MFVHNCINTPKCFIKAGFILFQMCHYDLAVKIKMLNVAAVVQLKQVGFPTPSVVLTPPPL